MTSDGKTSPKGLGDAGSEGSMSGSCHASVADSEHAPPLRRKAIDRLKTRRTDRISVPVGDIQPIDARFIEMVCEYLERVKDRITTQPEPRHEGLTSPRRKFVSDSVIEIIRSPSSGWHVDQSTIAPWQWDSVVLWAWEQVHLEMLSTARSHVDTDYARSIRALGHVARPVPHRVAEVPLCPDEHDTNP
jgi:hypothetical protein